MRPSQDIIFKFPWALSEHEKIPVRFIGDIASTAMYFACWTDGLISVIIFYVSSTCTVFSAQRFSKPKTFDSHVSKPKVIK